MKRNDRKWELIARYCSYRRYHKAALIADQIDAVLLQLYSDVNTPSWEYDFSTKYCNVEELTDTEVYDICNNPSYCIACVTHNHCGGCDNCAFGCATGQCCVSDSLFCQFCTEFEEVAEI